MSRQEIEFRLLEDADLRAEMQRLKNQAENVAAIKAELREARGFLHKQLVALAEQGIPNSMLARLIGVSHARISQELKESA